MHHTNHIYDIETKTYTQKTFQRLLKYLLPHRRDVIIALFLLVTGSLTLLLGPYLIKVAIDSYIIPGNYAGLTKIALLYFTVLAFGFIIRYAQVYLTQVIGQKIIHDLRMELFGHLQNLSMSFFDHNSVGKLMTRLTSDIEVLKELFTSGVIMTINDILTLAGVIIAMMILAPKLALITFTILPFLVFAAYLFRKKVTISFRLIRQKIAEINAYLQENITGTKTIKLFCREGVNFKRFDTLNAEHRDAYMDTVFYYALFYPAVEIISSVGIGCIIWYGGSQAIQKAIPLGILVAFIEYLERFFQPITDLSEKYNIFLSATTAGERIFKLLDTQNFISNPLTPAKFSKFQDSIVFKNVYFSYNDNEQEYVLKDINLTIKRGEKIAIVGATGAGKTSFLNVLARYYEIQKGEIFIDGIPANMINYETLRRQFALIQQDFFLLAENFRENISFGDKSISMDKIKEAARLSRAEVFIEKYEKKYEQNVFERGAILSTGQKQLLAFARAIAFDRPILLMDEATSNVDLETERLIQEGMENLLKNRTAIIIAHRLSTIRHADRIIVMHKGVIKEEGTHEELLQKQGVYYKLYQMQFR